MEELNRQIGQKIRALRISRGLTQSALAGDCITRNMLSLIENGSAAPSLHTLTELARQLDVPVGYFFASGEEETSQFTKMGMIGQLHRLLENGEFSECLALCSDLTPPDDEIRLVRSRCHFALAQNALNDAALMTADRHLEMAAADAERCIYTPDGFTSTLRFLSALIRAAGREEIPAELTAPGTFPGAWADAGFFAYLRALRALHTGDTETAAILRGSGLISEPLYLDFLDAGLAIRTGSPDTALPVLKKLIAAPPGFFTRYHVLTALESCAGSAGDFRSAYQYSAQKVRLLESFSK